MPEPKRTAVLLMGHASNEINLLRKLILIMSRQEIPKRKIVDHIQAGQTLILMRPCASGRRAEHRNEVRTPLARVCRNLVQNCKAMPPLTK